MEIFKAEDVPSTAIALLPNPMPVGPSGDNSSTIANTSQPMRPHNNTRFNASFAMVPAHSADHDAPAHRPDGGSVAPHTDDIPSLGKGLTFKLIQQLHARPLRVTIWPHDTTESIVSTVRNFFGLGRPTERLSVGVSLEDDRANTLIPSWANFNDGEIVYVRIFERLEPLSPTHDDGPGHPSVGLPESAGALDMAPWAQRQHISGLSYGVSRVRSPSPNDLRGRRSTPTTILGKRSRSPSTKKSHSGSQDGYSSGDSAPASSSSRTKDRSRATDISVENIVEGGRRKLAKFSSAELPLFAPPQMPVATSNSSVSPARGLDQHRYSMSAVHPGQNPFSNPHALASPQQPYTNGHGQGNAYQTPGYDARRSLPSYGGTRDGVVIPTPDPTIGTCVSEQDHDVAIHDVAMSLVSLAAGDASTPSTGAASTPSTGATSDAENDVADEGPAQRRQRLDASGRSNAIFGTTNSRFAVPQPSVEGDGDSHFAGSMAAPRTKGKSGSVNGTNVRALAKAKTAKTVKPKTKKAVSAGPMSPASLPGSRMQSVASNAGSPLAAGDDEHPDLSTKPRCQRCRKSKKGCDRQRPCGRCKDAGLSAEACISEDETNGRKGRYGRHMGVPLVKDEVVPAAPSLLPAAAIATANDAAAAMLGFADNNKKRKR